MAHTLYEDRDLNSSKELFAGLADIKTDPEMVQLATQLVQRQVSKYDSADLEVHYENRRRAMIDAKLKGEGIDRQAGEAIAPASNVIDLMAALKKRLGQVEAPEKSAQPKRKKAAEDVRRQQPALELPIKGGKAVVERAVVQAASKPSRKRAGAEFRHRGRGSTSLPFSDLSLGGWDRYRLRPTFAD
jgi:hypothetical protein